MFLHPPSLSLIYVFGALFFTNSAFATPALPSRQISRPASYTPVATAAASSTAPLAAITPAPISRRCEGDACNGNTEGGEQPIAVTTTIQTTVLVPCTTYVTVTNDLTTTMTSWATEVQTSTMTVSDTVSVVIMSPTPDIKSTVVTQSTNIAWSFTSYWTEGGTGPAVTSTVQGGSGYSSSSSSKTYQSPAQTSSYTSSSYVPVPVVPVVSCATCGYQSPSPSGWVSPTTAWTHTSAGVYVSSQPAGTTIAYSSGPAQPFDPASRFTGRGMASMSALSSWVILSAVALMTGVFFL